jgi:hypothetical protein
MDEVKKDGCQQSISGIICLVAFESAIGNDKILQ